MEKKDIYLYKISKTFFMSNQPKILMQYGKLLTFQDI